MMMMMMMATVLTNMLKMIITDCLRLLDPSPSYPSSTPHRLPTAFGKVFSPRSAERGSEVGELVSLTVGVKASLDVQMVKVDIS